MEVWSVMEACSELDQVAAAKEMLGESSQRMWLYSQAGPETSIIGNCITCELLPPRCGQSSPGLGKPWLAWPSWPEVGTSGFD